jgi:hypothetical protein
MRVNMSAIGSVIMVNCLFFSRKTCRADLVRVQADRYQLAFATPGISPLLARLRKQMRQIRNFRM